VNEALPLPRSTKCECDLEDLFTLGASHCVWTAGCQGRPSTRARGALWPPAAGCARILCGVTLDETDEATANPLRLRRCIAHSGHDVLGDDPICSGLGARVDSDGTECAHQGRLSTRTIPRSPGGGSAGANLCRLRRTPHRQNQPAAVAVPLAYPVLPPASPELCDESCLAPGQWQARRRARER
jgi:hypothetical protein